MLYPDGDDDFYHGIRRFGPMTITGLYANDSFVDKLRESVCNGQTIKIDQSVVSGLPGQFDAYVTKVNLHSSVDGLATVDVTLQPTGPPILDSDITSLQRARTRAKTELAVFANAVDVAQARKYFAFAIRGFPVIKKETPVKLKRFYIGKPEVVEGRDGMRWAKDTLAEAIEQAKLRAEETDQPQYIVKVIKVVRKKPQPVVVEDVK
jgi:hypothetical protein